MTIYQKIKQAWEYAAGDRASFSIRDNEVWCDYQWQGYSVTMCVLEKNNSPVVRVGALSSPKFSYLDMETYYTFLTSIMSMMDIAVEHGANKE